MSSITRYAIVLALGLSCAGLGSAVPCQTKTTKKTPTSSVSGRVTVHGKGVAGVVVGIRGLNGPLPSISTLKATTDADGNYQIVEVPAGNYQVFPMAPVYVMLDAVRGRGKMLLLAEGENVQGVDFSLARGGVITGKVTDADGRPVIEEQVTILPVDQNSQPLQMAQMYAPGNSGMQTDDRGVYRLYGLAAGRYKISVGFAEDNPFGNVGFGRAAYRRTFYPAATDPDDAKIIEITEGSEARNIDIALGRSLPAFSASGKVIDGETGQPVVGLRFGVRRVVNDGDAPIMNGIISASNSLGEFRLENVMPGKYVVLVMPQPGSEVRVDPVAFEVIDQDVTGLLVKTVRGLSVSGTLVLDGTYDKSAMQKLTQLRLSAFVRSDSESSIFGKESSIGPDGSFRIGGLAPGTANFMLGNQDRRPLVNFAVLRIERDGIAQPGGLEIKAGEQLTGVKIVVIYGTGSIRGEVKIENGPLPQGGRIMVWIRKPGDTTSNFRPYSLDSRGHFLIEGVAAGTYELNANANIPGRRGQVSTKQTISVAEDAVIDVALSLDLKSNPGQTP